jgi:hypothetical protein
MNKARLGLARSGLVRQPQRRLLSLAVASALAAGAAILVAPAVDARITKITIQGTSTAFGGFSFPGVGTYQRVYGTLTGELNPNDSHNNMIVDLALAPRNANGNVVYTTSFYILKPTDLTKGNHKVHYEPPNRGSKTYSALARTTGGGNDPASITDPVVLANSFLWPKGYTSIFVGWDQAAGTDPTNFNQYIILPVAKNADGSSITGPGYEYIVSPGASYTLTYTAASLDTTKAVLTHRQHLNDTPVAVPSTGWTYDSTGNVITLLPAGTSFTANDIYELSYTAKDPTVNGVGFASFRDAMAFFRFATADDSGTANPMAGDIQRVYTEISSQPGRFLNDFVTFGFNAAEELQNRKVIDGMMNWIAAGSGIGGNYRFGQPGRTARNRQHLLYAESVFPFANVSTTDPISGKTQGRYTVCERTNTCPFKMEIYSANEYWVKTASLLHTDPTGTTDLPDYPLARNYFMSSMQHGTGNATTKGLCQQLNNPLDSSPVQRALWQAMDDWSTKGVAPPPSMVPRLDNKTMSKPLPQSAVGFPNIPGVQYTGLETTRYRFNYGPNFYTTGIPTIYPPVVVAPYQDNPANGPIYQSYVPTTDADGNDIAGVRLPEVGIPLATFTGWGLRAIANDGPDGCESTGQYIPFTTTKAARVTAGDPRLSIQERYTNFTGFYYAMLNYIDGLVSARLFLPEDAATSFQNNIKNVLNNNLLPQ